LLAQSWICPYPTPDGGYLNSGVADH